MSKLYYFIILLYSSNIFSQKNSDSINYQEFKIHNATYKDFAYIDNNIYGLTIGDSLIIWNIIKNNISEIIPEVSAIVFKDNNLLYIKDNMINTYNKSVGINYDDKLKGKIYKLLFDKDDSPVVSTSKGIYYKGEYYVPNHDDGLYLMDYSAGKGDDIVSAAKVFFLDDEQRLWLGFDNGQNSGGLIIFDLKTKKFTYQDNLIFLYFKNHKITNKNVDRVYDMKKKANKKKLLKKYSELVKITETDTLYKFPYDFHISRVKGIAGNEMNYYLSESQFNLMLFRAKIIKISKTKYKDFYKIKSLDEILDYKTINNNIRDINEYVGPVSYNAYNNSAYYYSNLGFFKIIENQNGKFNKELILKPKALWTGMPDAAGYGMNITKFEFIDENKFIFLTTNNGLGYYNGKDVIYYK